MRGLRVRDAKKAVNTVFAAIAEALGKGETVELPGNLGLLQARLRNGKPRQTQQKHWNVNRKAMCTPNPCSSLSEYITVIVEPDVPTLP